MRLCFFLIFFTGASFICLKARAQSPDIEEFGLKLFNIVKEKNIQKFKTLLPSYDLLQQDYLTKGVEDYRRTLRDLDYTEAETEAAVQKLIEEVKSKKAQVKFTEYNKLLHEDFLKILNEGIGKGIVWQAIQFMEFKAVPVGPGSEIWLGKLLFSHEGKTFVLEVQEMRKIEDSYYGAELRLTELSR